MVAVACAVSLPDRWRLPKLGEAALVGAVVLHLFWLWWGSPCATLPPAAWAHARPWIMSAGASVAVAAAFPQRRTVALVGLLISYVGLGLFVLHAAPQPGVDVCLFQRESAAALLAGRNPYAITFADPYPADANVYGPGLSVGGRLQFGYPYPPLPLLMILPAHALGDFRFAQWAALGIAGAFIAIAKGRSRDCKGAVDPTTECPLPHGRGSFNRRDRADSSWGVPVAALLLFSPSTFFVLEAGWIEPLCVLFLAATVFFGSRVGVRSWAAMGLVISLGLLIASKQYMVLVLPLIGLLPAGSRCDRWVRLISALAIAAAASLPLALWNLPAFLHSVVWLQFGQPFRPDSLSLPAMLWAVARVQAPAWLAFVAAGGVAACCRWALPRSAGNFALAAGATLIVFFAFNKQAFCNYYFLVLGCLAAALGAAGRHHTGGETPHAGSAV